MGPGTGVEGGERENRRICFEVLRHLRRREGGREGGEAGEKEEEKAETHHGLPEYDANVFVINRLETGLSDSRTSHSGSNRLTSTPLLQLPPI